MGEIRNTKRFIVQTDAQLSEILKTIDINDLGFVLVEDNGKLIGLITDGDLRRFLINNPKQEPVASEICNRNFKYETDKTLKSCRFDSATKYIPVIKAETQDLISIRVEGHNYIEIEDFIINDTSPVFIIAEIGNNHNGSEEEAKKLVFEAKKAGANCAKFQYRDLESLYTIAKDKMYDLGTEYTLNLLEKFQLSADQLFRVFDYCYEVDIIPMCTPWDRSALSVLEKYGLPAYKIASADLTNMPLISNIVETGKPIILSTGMSEEWEIKNTIAYLEKKQSVFSLLHCNSTYPAPFKDTNLSYIGNLKNLCNGGIVGYSGHERGIEIPVAAVAMGAQIIEKHFTFDKSQEGSDHRVSLLPSEFEQMCAMIRNVEAAKTKTEKHITQGERINRENLSKSLVAARTIDVGEIITRNMVDIKSPGQGIQPNMLDNLVGTKSIRSLKKHDYFYESDLLEQTISKSFEPTFFEIGIPVRYHDFHDLTDTQNLDFVEFHLSYKDLERNLEGYNLNNHIKNFAVHCPELFNGDEILDLTTTNPVKLQNSIENVLQVIDVTQRLNGYFDSETKPKIIINAGGFSEDAFLDPSEVKNKYEVLKNSLKFLNNNRVELIFQTMPPFPWHFGGQRFHNLFTQPDDIIKFCGETGSNICLDTSHTMMSAQHFGFDFYDVLTQLAPHCQYLHIADSSGVDGEGVEMGLGDIDFKVVSTILNSHYKKSTRLIPEIWQGHKNSGERFWSAIRYLNEKKF